MLDDRKSAILRAVVQQYIETAQPVGSSSIAARSEVNVSSATVRNDMTQLETEGYLVQPHTSAGRIPTEQGYRYFVDTIAQPGPMNPASVQLVKEFFSSAHGELESMLAETSRLLSEVTNTAAVVIGDSGEVATVRSVQLVDLSATTVLAVVVLSDGTVLKRSFEHNEDLDADELAAAQAIVQETVVGTRLSEHRVTELSDLRPGAELALAALAALEDAVEAEGSQMFVDGRSRIAGSFDARDTIEAVLEILEQQFVVVTLLKQLVDSGLAVAIGSEHGVEPLADCSVVVAPYQVGGEPAGAIAVLGPTRMNYPETLSTVAVVSQRLSRVLTEG